EPIRAALETRLMAILEAESDPRLVEQPCRYEYEPYAGKVAKVWFEAAAEEQGTFNPTQTK
ncbi:hypothetical protein OAR36_14405, partial [Pseudomonadales bacterium]|nr:hypothetical protein [Pseudomonadales bacterium]